MVLPVVVDAGEGIPGKEGKGGCRDMHCEKGEESLELAKEWFAVGDKTQPSSCHLPEGREGGHALTQRGKVDFGRRKHNLRPAISLRGNEVDMRRHKGERLTSGDENTIFALPSP
jgi:hypothetical protein